MDKREAAELVKSLPNDDLWKMLLIMRQMAKENLEKGRENCQK